MSSPSETQSVKSVTVSSPLATDATYEDTASSVQGTGPPPGVVVTFVPDAPNTSYQRRMRDFRARSASPRPRRTISSSGLSVAQQRAQIAELKAESAFSGIGLSWIRPVMHSLSRKLRLLKHIQCAMRFHLGSLKLRNVRTLAFPA